LVGVSVLRDAFMMMTDEDWKGFVASWNDGKFS